MQIALAQINPIVGDIEGNLEKITEIVSQAKDQGADLVCFSELALTGYPPLDLLDYPNLLVRSQKAIAKLQKQAKGIAILVGTIWPNPKKFGKKLVNACLWLEKQKIRLCYAKQLLPNYDVFDESRYFEAGTHPGLITFKGQKIGLTICEDIWSLDPNLRYASHPINELKHPNLIINLSASPYSMGHDKRRKQLAAQWAKKKKCQVLYLNQVGGNDAILFDGGSFCLDSKGKLLTQLPFFEEGLEILNLKAHPQIQQNTIGDLEILERALVTGIRDYFKKMGFKKAVLGLSGGVDSALVAYLACKALGPEFVTGILMPSRYSSKGSVEDSVALARNLGMPTQRVQIHALHAAYETIFQQMFGPGQLGVVEENIQARIRGSIIMAHSNKTGALALMTGNKSELTAGYATLYGDVIGAISVIGDVTKTRVYELCERIQIREKIFPQAILTKAPSAELRPNQTDQDSLPPYKTLDGILELAVEECLDAAAIIKKGFPKEVVNQVLRLLQMSEYKRFQAPPILRVTRRAFGLGRRMPIACKHKPD